MTQVAVRGQVTGLRRPGQLPAEATGFVGRLTEPADIAALLGTARLVTVTGPAGVGKTRVALRAAQLAAAQFPDGVCFLDLSALASPELADGDPPGPAPLVRAVAAATGADLPGSGPGAALLTALRGKRLLLILDTCEHLVDDCATFADWLLRAVPGVRLLATSRQPLDAQGEHVFPLLPLPAQSDAVDLFAQRAAAVVPGFTVTAQSRADVVRLCQRLDGLPLAIELAAVRLRALPLGELASQLESGIRTLTVSRRGTSPRHQTLRDAVDWSYQLCSPAEQTLWQRLSVFAGTFDVTGAEHVCADGLLIRDQVVHALIGLVEKSVVLREAGAQGRYRLLGALREFGADRLAEAGEQERFAGRLTVRCLGLARQLDESLQARADAAADQAGALRRLRHEHDNIEAALSFTLAAPGLDEPFGTRSPAVTARRRLGAALAVRLTCYWQVAGLLDEGREWLGRVIQLFPEPARERGWALGARGRLATFAGDLGGAADDISESIRLAESAGTDAELSAARGYLYLNLALAFAGQPAEAAEAANVARQRLAARGDQSGLAGLLVQLGQLHQLSGNVDQAIASCDEGWAAMGTAADGADPAGPEREHWISGWLHLVAGLALSQRPGQEHACATELRRALAAKHKLGDVVGTAYAVEALAWLAVRREQYERAAWLIGAADQLWARIGRRLSGIARLEDCRHQTLRAARKALGERRYATAHAHGSTLDLAAVVEGAADPVFDPPGRRGDALAPARGDQAGRGQADPDPAAALTKREREIAELVSSGLSNREVASRLFISKRTVDAHVEHIFGKLEISSRVQLTLLLSGRARPGRG